MNEVADLPALDSEFRLRYLAERIRIFFKLGIETARLGKSSSGSSERKASGKEWIASWTLLGARRKGNQEESPTVNERLRWVVRASKYRVKVAARIVVSEIRSVTDPLSLTLAVTARGRVQLAFLRTRVAMSEKVAAIRRDSVCSVGEE